MCLSCKENGPKSIAGVHITSYLAKIRSNQRFRLHLCHELQASLLVSLQKHGVTADTSLRGAPAVCSQLWHDVGLDYNYEHHLRQTLMGKLRDRTDSLLAEARKWGAFIQDSSDHGRLVWDPRVVEAHFGAHEAVMAWMKERRAAASQAVSAAPTAVPSHPRRGPPRSRLPREGPSQAKITKAPRVTTPRRNAAVTELGGESSRGGSDRKQDTKGSSGQASKAGAQENDEDDDYIVGLKPPGAVIGDEADLDWQMEKLHLQ